MSSPHPVHDIGDKGSRELNDIELLGLAMDEIWQLRCALAYESQVREADLHFKSYPKSRRAVATEAVERMTKAACGHVQVAYAGLHTAKAIRVATRDQAHLTVGEFRAYWNERWHHRD